MMLGSGSMAKSLGLMVDLLFECVSANPSLVHLSCTC